MAKQLSKSGISTNDAILAWHVTQSVDAFTGTDAYDVTVSGSLTITGSTSGTFTGSFTGSFDGSITSASYATTATSASYATTATSASYALTASFLEGGVTSASYAATASYILASNINQPFTDITASGNISASGTIVANKIESSNLVSHLGDANTGIAFGNDTVVIEANDINMALFSTSGQTVGNALYTTTILGSSLIVTPPITASGNISSSGTVSMLTASIGGGIFTSASLAGGGGGSGAGFPFTGDAVITGSLVVSASATSQSLSVIGSGSVVFDVIGSAGTLFSVDDSLTGTIFSSNDISGLPILQVDSTGEVYLGKSPQSLYTTAIISATSASSTASLTSLSTSSYDGAFFDYTITSASNARAGSIMSVWNGGTVSFTETTTTDIGSTSGLDLQVIISASQAQLVAITDSTSPNIYKVKTIIKAI